MQHVWWHWFYGHRVLLLLQSHPPMRSTVSLAFTCRLSTQWQNMSLKMFKKNSSLKIYSYCALTMMTLNRRVDAYKHHTLSPVFISKTCSYISNQSAIFQTHFLCIAFIQREAQNKSDFIKYSPQRPSTE